MSKKKAWWKKISLKSVTGAVGTVFSFLTGGLAASQQPPTVNVVVPEQKSPFSNPVTWVAIGGGVLLLIFLMQRKR